MDAISGRLRVSAALLLACAAFACLPGTAAAGPVAPASDPFYSYSGSLRDLAPGTVLRSRQVMVSAAGSPATLTGTQVLYRTQNQLGQPDATVATIIGPAAQTGQPKLLSYQTFYDGDAGTCRPSYTMQGGDPSNAGASADETLLLDYVNQGFTVVTSDYEGSTDDYGAGRQSGYETLDAIRAAERVLKLTPAAPVGMVGYSGGAIASEWGSELQPGYAPELNIVGVAEGGIPADFTHNVAYINGSSDWAGAIPSVLLGLARAYKVNLPEYLSPEGAQIIAEVSKGCLNPSAYPGLKLQDLLKPQYKDWQKVPIFVRIFNDTIMGRSDTPKSPLLMAVGDADGTGDGVMVTADVQELAHIYCQRGVPVEFHIYTGANHDEAAVPFETAAIQFLQERYAGQPFSSQCSSIAAGNPLTPLPTPPQATPKPRLKLRYFGARPRLHGLVIAVSTTTRVLRDVTVELKRGNRVVAKVTVARLTTKAHRIVLRVRRGIPIRGRYSLVILIGRTTVLHRTLTAR